VVTFSRPKSGYFCWSNYAIFQGKPQFESASYHQFRKGLKRAPNSGPRFSQATQISYIYKMYLKGLKACCAQGFATVLAIRSEISVEQARNQGARRGDEAPLERFSPPLEKCAGYSLKLLDTVQKICAPVRKLFAPPGVPSWLRAWRRTVSETHFRPGCKQNGSS